MGVANSTEAYSTPRSLLGQSVGVRLALVGALLVALWASVFWALH